MIKDKTVKEQIAEFNQELETPFKLKLYNAIKEDLWTKSIEDLTELYQQVCATRGAWFTNEHMFRLVGITALESKPEYVKMLKYLYEHVVKKPAWAWEKDGAIWYEDLIVPRIHATCWSNPKKEVYRDGGYPRHPHTVSLGFDDEASAEKTMLWLSEHKQCKALGYRIDEYRTQCYLEIKVWGMSDALLTTLVKRFTE